MIQPVASPAPTAASAAEAPDTRHVIVNAISGERIVIRQSGAETNGELLAFDLFLPPGGHVPSGHTHPVQEERFTVISGTMRFKLRGATILAHPGEVVAVPPGTPHWFGNAGSAEAHALVEVRPALRMEEVFEYSAAMRHTGEVFGTRLPSLTDLAQFLIAFHREVAVPHVPSIITRAVLAPLAWFGRKRPLRAARGSGA